ncbi:MAG: hypothetical protein AAGJ97_01260, partial [Planctomycetota bacterium]
MCILLGQTGLAQIFPEHTQANWHDMYKAFNLPSGIPQAEVFAMRFWLFAFFATVFASSSQAAVIGFSLFVEGNTA